MHNTKRNDNGIHALTLIILGACALAPFHWNVPDALAHMGHYATAARWLIAGVGIVIFAIAVLAMREFGQRVQAAHARLQESTNEQEKNHA